MAKKDDSPKNIKCSFCGKTQEHVDRIVAGPGVYICDECIEVCKNIIDNDYLYQTYIITYCSLTIIIVKLLSII